MTTLNSFFEPYHRKMGCIAAQTADGKWYVAHPNGDAEPAKSRDDALAKALYNNATGGRTWDSIGLAKSARGSFI